MWMPKSHQALQVSSNFRELEKKYGTLTSMMSSQSQLIARLENQCQCKDESQYDPVRKWSVIFHSAFTSYHFQWVFFFPVQVPTDSPKSRPAALLNDSSEISNALQRDQSALQEDNHLGALLIPSTTVQPVISSPVTKTPGTYNLTRFYSIYTPIAVL